MNTFRILSIFIFLSIFQVGNTQVQEEEKVIIGSVLQDNAIKLDGKVDEEFWQNTPYISDFLTREPVESGQPSEITEVRIAFDEKNIYIAAIMYDSDPSGIKAFQMKRDASLRTDDRFQIIFDTFLDRRRAYFFEINPRAMRGDGLLSTGQNSGFRAINKDWDGIWKAWTHIGEFGWSAEIRIPFQTMNFDPNNDTWGANFARTIRRSNEELVWSGSKRNQGLYRPQNAGILTGLKGMSQGLGLEVIPYGIAQSQKLQDPETGEKDTDSQVDGGFDVNYNITSSLKASFTYNTDFAQTEVDDRQINLTRFPLRFPEKRDFFLEGTSILQVAPSSRVDPYFSRRIGLSGGLPIPINYGGRVLGNLGNTNLAVIHVKTAAVDTINPETFTVTRIKHNIFKESSIGIIYTRRSTRDGEELPEPLQNRHTLGADLELNTSNFLGDKVLQFSAFYIGHNSADPHDDESSQWDRSVRGIRLNFPNQPWSGSISYREFGDLYDPAVGFNRRNGFRRFQPTFRYTPLFENSNLIRSMEWGLWYERLWSLENMLLTENYRFNLGEVRFESGERIEWGATRNFEFLDEEFDILRDGSVIVPVGEYTNWQYEVGVSSASFRKISGSLRFETGGFWTGNKSETRLRLTLRPNPGINLSIEYEHTDVSVDEGGFSTNLLQLEMGFDFTPDISLSSNIQYDDVSKVIGTNTRFRWILTPGTDVFFVYNHNWLNDAEYRMYTLNQGAALKGVYTHRF
ncbi:MAG: carbohydrate binding family 9 domain-containing protein [Saprospiraceae bacterium]|nr:carbohydrate binding family 9 domain-containing protein [Saprospiraceae bacterium]